MNADDAFAFIYLHVVALNMRFAGSLFTIEAENTGNMDVVLKLLV